MHQKTPLHWPLSQAPCLHTPAPHPQPNAPLRYLIFYKRMILIHRENNAYLHSSALIDQNIAAFSQAQQEFIGHHAGSNCFALSFSEENLPARPLDYDWLTMREARLHLSISDYALAGRGLQLLEWRDNHRFCGHCGQATKRKNLAMACSHCALELYPPVSPSMIVLIHRDAEVLLARSPHFPQGVYSTLAGYVEPGESVEQCIHREVREEVGVRVSDLRYLGSQPWPFPHALMLGYHATYAGGDIAIDPSEIEDARWWPLDQLPPIPPQSSIAGWLIRKRVQDWQES